MSNNQTQGRGVGLRMDLTQMAIRGQLRFIMRAILVELLFLAPNQRMSLEELRRQAASVFTVTSDGHGDVSIAIVALLESGTAGVRDGQIWLTSCEGMHVEVHPDIAVPALFHTIRLYLQAFGKSTRTMLANAMAWRGFTPEQTSQAIGRLVDNGLVTVEGDWVEMVPPPE